MQRLGQEEGALEVEVEHLVPAGCGEFLERRTPGRAGVVDQDVQVRLARRVGRHEAADAGLGGHVGGQRLARAQCRQLGGGGVARRGLARRDVDAGARPQEAGRDHAADAARATGDERAAPTKILRRKILNLCHACRARRVRRRYQSRGRLVCDTASTDRSPACARLRSCARDNARSQGGSRRPRYLRAGANCRLQCRA